MPPAEPTQAGRLPRLDSDSTSEPGPARGLNASSLSPLVNRVPHFVSVGCDAHHIAAASWGQFS